MGLALKPHALERPEHRRSGRNRSARQASSGDAGGSAGIATESCSLSPAEDRGAARAGTGGVDLAGFPPEPRREHLHQHHAGGLDLQAPRRSRRMALPAGRHGPEGGRQRSARGPASATPRAGGRPLRGCRREHALRCGTYQRRQTVSGPARPAGIRRRACTNAGGDQRPGTHPPSPAHRIRAAACRLDLRLRRPLRRGQHSLRRRRGDRARRSRPPLCRDRRQGGPALADRRDARHGRQPQPDMDGARLAHQEGHHPPCPQGSRLSATR